MKSWILWIGFYGEVQKSDFQSQFLTSKIIQIFLFFLNGKKLGAHFLLLTFLITSIFMSLYILTWDLPNFWKLGTTPILKV